VNGQDPITTALESYVEAGQMTGAAALVWRHGKVAHASIVGWRDFESNLMLERDSIFRIASMTKPVTSTAAMILVEEGRIALDDAITRWAPEFADMRVLQSPDGPLDKTVPAARAITFGDLLTHRSGLTYGSFHTGPLARAYEAALGSDIDSRLTPDQWIAAVAGLPLIDQPGAGFHYGNSTDVLGLLIARIEGAPLKEVLRSRIFEPLGMPDTGFFVPEDKYHRRAQMYGFDESGALAPRPNGPILSGPAGVLLSDRREDDYFVAGSGGLWSTVDDYLTFARMFVGQGAVDGVRLLRPESLALMMANHLSDDQRARGETFGMPIFTGHGFGLGVAVVMDPDKAAVTRCKGGHGTVGWPGAYGGWWQADPTNGTVMVFLTHNVIELHQFALGVGLGVYGAIMELHALASRGA